MRILRIKNYEKYQNHRAKDPRWVKLYRTILTDQAFIRLDPVSRYIYIGLVILASETGNSIVNDVPYLCHRLAIPATQLNLKPLICSGLIVASLRTIQRQKSLSETERETEQTSPPTIVPVKKKVPTTFPETFAFTKEMKEWALAEGCAEPFAEFQHFRDKAIAEGKLYLDWAAAFRTWIHNHVKWKREKANAKVLQNVR